MSETRKPKVDRRARFEVIGFSEKSFSAATADAVARAGVLFEEFGFGDALGRFEVLTMRGPIEGGIRTGYEITIRVGVADAEKTSEGGSR